MCTIKFSHLQSVGEGESKEGRSISRNHHHLCIYESFNWPIGFLFINVDFHPEFISTRIAMKEQRSLGINLCRSRVQYPKFHWSTSDEYETWNSIELNRFDIYLFEISSLLVNGRMRWKTFAFFRYRHGKFIADKKHSPCSVVRNVELQKKTTTRTMSKWGDENFPYNSKKPIIFYQSYFIHYSLFLRD